MPSPVLPMFSTYRLAEGLFEDEYILQQQFGDKLVLLPAFEHCIFVPYESHSLNLIVSDWIELSGFELAYLPGPNPRWRLCP